MKKSILTALATLALGMSLTSYTLAHENNEIKQCDQPRNGWEKHEKKHHSKHLKHMAKALALTEQQVDEMKALYEQARFSKPKPHRPSNLWQLDPQADDYNEKVAEIAKQRSLEAEQAVLKRAELRAATYNILTPEQKQKAAELRLKHQNKLKS